MGGSGDDRENSSYYDGTLVSIIVVFAKSSIFALENVDFISIESPKKLSV